MVYDAPGTSKQDWKGLSQVIQVIRKVEHADGHHSTQDAYYIDSTGKNAQDLNQGIRGHWSIENTLHWTKDVVFKEDASKIHMGQAPENLSLVKNWVMAIFRKNGYESMTKAIRLVANDLQLMINLLE